MSFSNLGFHFCDATQEQELEDYFMTPELFRKRLLDSEICKPEHLEGCSESDLVDLEQTINAKLPEAYKDALRVFGRKADGFLDGVKVTYPEILTLTKTIRLFLKEFHGMELPPDAFVIGDYEKSEILFIRLTHLNNEVVYKWDIHNMNDEFFVVNDSIWDLFTEELELEEKQARRSKELRQSK